MARPAPLAAALGGLALALLALTLGVLLAHRRRKRVEQDLAARLFALEVEREVYARVLALGLGPAREPTRPGDLEPAAEGREAAPLQGSRMRSLRKLSLLGKNALRFGSGRSSERRRGRAVVEPPIPLSS